MGYFLMTGLGFSFLLIGQFALYSFFRIKWPGYLDDVFQMQSRG